MSQQVKMPHSVPTSHLGAASLAPGGLEDQRRQPQCLGTMHLGDPEQHLDPLRTKTALVLGTFREQTSEWKISDPPSLLNKQSS